MAQFQASQPLEDLEIKINNKAINMLQCALNLMEFNKVFECDTAKEIWHMLEEVKKTTIEEAKNLNTLKLDDLIGNLETYEIDIKVDDEVEVVEKKKNIAFKASNQTEESEDDACDGEDISTLIFKEVGHYRNECPQLKKGEKKDKNSMKKKTFAITWSDDETSSTESESSLENGVANLCFMAQEDSYSDEEVNSNFSNSINESSFEYFYDDFCKVLDCFVNDIKKLGNENLAFTKTISLLKNEIESLSKQNKILVKENASLIVEIASLKNEESSNALRKENENLKKKVCLVSKMKNKWYLDSGCSRHMMGDPSQFSSLIPLDGGTVTFGDNGKGIVKGIGKIGDKSISFDDNMWMD
ncbi:hypothetical protein SLEP1_g55568 [Rubroshorea leprosula]|uniref:Retrovirus-related Pol polyprotein from transposon TNT 1-94-like beta-barrel domain-containing protein n=1 Tax=Rubroshorea leprosula TaxID=152421 RepID=A0AAV5MFV8_9ROSI|nr:hypothetical protein SLEP1_g55568 [Rubroshorea leprosula]